LSHASTPARRPNTLKVSTRNASFQQWQAQLTNRTKRHRTGRFLVQGVRPITIAVRYGWPIEALLYSAEISSGWASEILRDVRAATHYELTPDLMRELGEKAEQPPELLAVAVMPPDDLDRIPVPPDALLVIMDRPGSPGNVGTLIRSADALGAHGLIVTGHATDLYDPRTVRASTGSLFAIPAVRVAGPGEVSDWIGSVRSRGIPLNVVLQFPALELHWQRVRAGSSRGVELTCRVAPAARALREWDYCVSAYCGPPERAGSAATSMATAEATLAPPVTVPMGTL